MPFSIQKTNASVLGKEETIYYVSANQWTTVSEDKAIFDTEESAQTASAAELFDDCEVIAE